MKKNLLFLFVTFFFIASASAVTQNLEVGKSATDSLISNAYPNPASEMIYVDYKLPLNINKAKIRVSNLLGLPVLNIDLVNNTGTTAINVSEFKNGVYFYSLMINNSPTTTRKFVVRR